MRQMLRAVGLIVAFVLMVLMAACGGHSASPTAPTSPSATPTSPAPAPSPANGSGATITGTIASQSGPASSVVVGVQNTNMTAPADPAGNFTLSNVPASDVTLTFTSAGVQATVPIGAVAANDKVQVAVTVSGSAATLDAQLHTTPTNTVEATGTIDNLDVNARSFTLNGTSVVVNTDATIRRGDQAIGFTGLQKGDRVAVHGVKDGSTIRATEVIAAGSTSSPSPTPTPTPTPTPSPTPTPTPSPTPTPTPPTTPSPAPTEPAPVPDTTVNGTISGLSGACPVVSMTVAGTAVKTNASTSFASKACPDLKNGDTVYAIGPKQSDGSIAASKIYYVAPPAADVTVSGSIANLSGTCTSMQFTLSSTVVKTNAATTFSGAKGCSVLANGDPVTVVGKTQTDGSLLASSVQYTGSTSTDTYVNGAITGLSGTCPSLTFTLSGTIVRTNASTAFNGRACSELKNGDVIYAAGPKQSDGSIAANRTYYTAPTPPTVTLTGTVSNLGGAWPALTFTVQGTAVTTTSSTVCDGTKGCSLLGNGDSVTVTGTQQSATAVTATKVTNATPAPAPAPTPSFTTTGVVGSVSGACPGLTLSVNGFVVKAASSTTYVSGHGCTAMNAGDYVQVNGTQGTDGSVAASSINYSTATTGLYAIGTVQSVSGTCPALTIVVSGVTVKTGAATTFGSSGSTFTCADVKAGIMVYTQSNRQSDGSLLANFVVPGK